jgi:hypothetical protein
MSRNFMREEADCSGGKIEAEKDSNGTRRTQHEDKMRSSASGYWFFNELVCSGPESGTCSAHLGPSAYRTLLYAGVERAESLVHENDSPGGALR